MPNLTCPECSGIGGTYLDASLTDKIPCRVCGGSGEKQFKVVKKGDAYEVVVKTKFSLRTSYFTGNWSDCRNYADQLNNPI